MAKDLEKVNEKLEKQNRKLKRRNSAGGKIILFLLLIILIFAAIAFFIDPFGWGFNLNSLTGSTTADTQQSQQQEQTDVSATDAPKDSEAADGPAETEPQIRVISVRVSDKTYYLDNAETTADKIVETLTELDSEAAVEITDDSATKNALDALIAALEAAHIPYTIK